MKSIRQVFGENLRKLRGNLSKEAFSEIAGVPASTYEKLEAGKKNLPQQKTLNNLVKKLKLPSETVLFMDQDIKEWAPPVQPEPAHEISDCLAAVTRAIKGTAAAGQAGRGEPAKEKLIERVRGMDVRLVARLSQELDLIERTTAEQEAVVQKKRHKDAKKA